MSGSEGETAVGLGLFRIDLGPAALVGHAGRFVGSEALAGWTEDDGTLVVVIGNRSRFDARRVAAALVAESRAPASATGGRAR